MHHTVQKIENYDTYDTSYDADKKDEIFKIESVADKSIF